MRTIDNRRRPVRWFASAARARTPKKEREPRNQTRRRRAPDVALFKMLRPVHRTRALILVAVLAAIFALTACSARVDTRGNLPDPDVVAQITPGEDDRNTVIETLGSPSTTAVFDEEVWYYISQRTETLAFFAPKVVERQVLIVHFDERGIVTAIEALGLDDSRTIEHVERTTPTAGNELTFIDQLVGNFGRFNK